MNLSNRILGNGGDRRCGKMRSLSYILNHWIHGGWQPQPEEKTKGRRTNVDKGWRVVREAEGSLYECMHTGRAVMIVICKGLRDILPVLGVHSCIKCIPYLLYMQSMVAEPSALYRRFIIVNLLFLSSCLSFPPAPGRTILQARSRCTPPITCLQPHCSHC